MIENAEKNDDNLVANLNPFGQNSFFRRFRDIT